MPIIHVKHLSDDPSQGWRFVSVDAETEGNCLTCGRQMDVSFYTYQHTSGRFHTESIRGPCDCSQWTFKMLWLRIWKGPRGYNIDFPSIE